MLSTYCLAPLLGLTMSILSDCSLFIYLFIYFNPHCDTSVQVCPVGCMERPGGRLCARFCLNLNPLRSLYCMSKVCACRVFFRFLVVAACSHADMLISCVTPLWYFPAYFLFLLGQRLRGCPVLFQLAGGCHNKWFGHRPSCSFRTPHLRGFGRVPARRSWV